MEDFIYQLSKEILSDLHLEKMLINISDKIKSYIGAERASLFVYDENDNTLNSVVLLADTGKIKSVQIPVSKESIAGYTALSGKILNIKNVHDFDELYRIDRELRYHSHWLYIPEVKTESVISVPITRDRKVIGVFQAINKEGGFTEEDEKKLKKLSPLIALAIDRAIYLNRLEMLRSIEKTVLENIREGVALVDLNLKVKEVNSSFIEMLGYRFTEEDIKEKNIFDIIPRLKEYKKKIDFVVENQISEEISLEIMRIKIIPINWECFTRKDIKYLALIFNFPHG
ncbi:PAS domain S-box-containing protein [Persephonella hydrogeniphila]|uniref:PAS domain S-box-containing protein n=1 Tax=Persephonella hydrogeniphila TaxID=198703 RepID=A0A285NCL8_9AQUI|nr:GAF domain-containing protein [Persephonella hydrogeniphila]SNZ06687.1 PAS domain S-box-containing protein [Persephonella hydrogeniphila]